MKIIHNEKSLEILRNEAEDLACLISDRLPADAHKNIMAMFEEYADYLGDNSDTDDINLTTPTSENQPEEQNKMGKAQMRMLFTHLENNADFHVHLIAPEVAAFLYVEVPWIKDNLFTSSAKYISSHNQDGLDDPFKTFQNDPRLADTWKCWLSMRDALVKNFIRSQHAYCVLQETIKEYEEQKDNEEDKSKIKFSNSEHSKAEELLEELNMMRIRENGEKVGRDFAQEKIVNGRYPTKATLRFECHMLNGKFGPYGDQKSSILADLDDSNTMLSEICPEIANQLPAATRTIFVDNLPINIDKEELDDLYSRCGGIESIEIFNLHPELDPGELGAEALKKLRKQRRMTGIKNVKYSRERTPIYAMITFKDTDGFERATNDMLRIFGMVIRRLAAKSFPARNLHKIYIENVHNGYFAIDVEQKLSKALHPHMYLSLEIGQHVNSQPRNLTLSFPSFEAAHYAYQHLKTLNFESEECTINWMPTPKNSMAYWTREIVPDP